MAAPTLGAWFPSTMNAQPDTCIGVIHLHQTGGGRVTMRFFVPLLIALFILSYEGPEGPTGPKGDHVNANAATVMVQYTISCEGARGAGYSRI